MCELSRRPGGYELGLRRDAGRQCGARQGLGYGAVLGRRCGGDWNHSANNDQTDQCNICHVYADTPYNASPIGWWCGTGRTYHGNDNIDMNSTLSYNGTNFNCVELSLRDLGNTDHNLEDSGWTVNPLAGPAVDCFTCHGDGSANYWPSGTVYPDRPACTRRTSTACAEAELRFAALQ